ncbi:hypothetical protein MYAM1_002804 [Malassezia yamatoensis]|uniref:Rrn7/TAF1B C-terminal cyclin domain-containing protein n=1 Tax=Malassezia yamatoensis TaxID=253288 RepID=A0AAJ5YYT4_9BASI|nr:hypothetical protein MYAM1_002804 [Malassezia yamatoensis]
MQARRKCALCGSTKFRLLASQLVCSAGHLQRDFRVEAAQEDEGFGTQLTTRARTLNRNSQREAAQADRRRRKHHARRLARGRTSVDAPESQSEANLAQTYSEYLSGDQANFAVLEALQLLLRHQIRAIQQLYSVRGIEHSARNIWGLHVSYANIPAAPLLAAQNTYHANKQTNPTQSSPFLNAHNKVETVSLRSTIAVLYLALVLERLDTENVPTVMEIHRRCNDIATRLQLDFALDWPEVNAVPLLSRFVHRMFLPPAIYIGAKTLLSFLHIDMHLRNVSAQLPNHSQVGGREPSILSYSRNASIPRCVMLMAAIVIAVKLHYGLDGSPRYDPLQIGLPPLDSWLSALRVSVGLESNSKLAHYEPANAPFCPWDTSTDLLGLSDHQLDQYLDFYEQEYLMTDFPNSMRHARRDNIHDLASVGGHTSANPVNIPAIEKQHMNWTNNLRTQLYKTGSESIVSPSPDLLESGEAYPIYAHDPAGVLPRELIQVMECANHVLGMETDPIESFQIHDARQARDQDVLQVAVMQFDEAILATLQRRRNTRPV